MSVYKHQDSPFYHFDFQLKGNRFHGSTGCTNERDARTFERSERDKAKQQMKAASPVSTKLDDVAGRYWQEVGQHHAAPTPHGGISNGCCDTLGLPNSSPIFATTMSLS
jgi:hypothetical protein